MNVSFLIHPFSSLSMFCNGLIHQTEKNGASFQPVFIWNWGAMLSCLLIVGTELHAGNAEQRYSPGSRFICIVGQTEFSQSTQVQNPSYLLGNMLPGVVFISSPYHANHSPRQSILSLLL